MKIVKELSTVVSGGYDFTSSIPKSSFNSLNTFLGSESKAIYTESIEQLEKWSELIYFVVAKLSPVFWVAPKFLMSLFVYMTTNFDNNALELPLPIW